MGKLSKLPNWIWPGYPYTSLVSYFQGAVKEDFEKEAYQSVGFCVDPKEEIARL